MLYTHVLTSDSHTGSLLLSRCRSGGYPGICKGTHNPRPGPENCCNAAQGPGLPEASFCAWCSSHTLCKAAHSGSAAPVQTGSFSLWQRGSLHRAASGGSCLLRRSSGEGTIILHSPPLPTVCQDTHKLVPLLEAASCPKLIPVGAFCDPCPTTASSGFVTVPGRYREDLSSV